jgi:hydroxyacylglutathione hydrolase
VKIFHILNTILSSNTYLLSSDFASSVYVIDPGDVLPILNWIKFQKKYLAGIILTHSHYDHIYGVNELLSKFPDCKLFIENKMMAGLKSAKLNTSQYHERPYVLEDIYANRIILINENCTYYLWESQVFTMLCTPGHTPDSISIKVDNCLFCGDALIPGMNTYIVKNSNLNDIKNSINSIFNTLPSSTVLLPGHGKSYKLRDLKYVEKFTKYEPTYGVCNFLMQSN